MRVAVVAAIFAALSASAQARSDTPLAKVFMHGVSAVCVPNATGRLPFNPPSDALTKAGVLLADPTDAQTLLAFHDLSVRDRIFGAMAGSDGKVIVAQDASLQGCRVAAFDATDDDVAAIQAALRAQSGDWRSTDQGVDMTQYAGEIGGRPMLIRVQTPHPGQGWGRRTRFMVTVMDPSPR